MVSDTDSVGVARAVSPSGFAALFTPKLATILREGYRLADLRADAIAGLTVAVVALPLSMAIAIASGAPPARGLYTAIIGGFFISLLGGSRFQIGGPAGAFIVLVAACVAQYGLVGLAAATIMAGLMLIVAGFLRLGAYIKFVPYPVTVGFTAGIATIIFASQIGDLFGLSFAGGQPGALLPKLEAIAHAMPRANGAAIAIALGTIVLIAVLKRLKPHWPGFLIALALASVAAVTLGLPVETIGTRFGGIPSTLPSPQWPSVSFATLTALLPSAFAFALLGSIESLLSATVADGMTGRRHRSNCELVAQGVANIASGFFGGLPVTGAIARTATNIRAGARGPLSGIFHSGFVLLFIVAAAPVARFIPLAALAGVLSMVAWNMIEKRAFATLITASRGDAIVLLVTFLLTIFRDVTTGILFGFAAGTMLFLMRMAKTVGIEGVPLVAEDVPDDTNGGRTRYDSKLAVDPTRVVYRLSGAFFFGAAAAVGAVLDSIGEKPKTLVLDFAAVPIIDSTAAVTIAGFAKKAAERGVTLYLTGTSPDVRSVLEAHGAGSRAAIYAASIAEAVGKSSTVLVGDAPD